MEKIKEDYEYLFLDIEWNQELNTTGLEGQEPIQIAAIATDEYFNIQKSFSKYVCLEDMSLLTEKTCKLTHVTPNVIETANSSDVVFERFVQSFRHYKFVVVWTEETYLLWKDYMKKHACKMPRYKVIVVQDIFRQIISGEKLLSFQKALDWCGISYQENFLHYSKHDVSYLHEVYVKALQKYSEATKYDLCYLNERTKKVHLLGCRYMEDLRFLTMVEAEKSILFHGYKACRCCYDDSWEKLEKEQKVSTPKAEGQKFPAKNLRKLRNLPLTEENIIKICNGFGFDGTIREDCVFFTTPFSAWRIYIKENDEVKKVFHENYRIKRSEFYKKKKCNEGFHEQSVKQKNFYDVIEYIYYHEKSHTRVAFKKSRIDILFEQIEKDMKKKA